MDDTDWRQRATCKGAPLSLFFPAEHPSLAAIDQVRVNYCDRCPVRRECATEAHRNRETSGIWAGRFMGTGWTPRRAAWRRQKLAELWLVASE